MTFKIQNKFIPGFIGWIGLLGDVTPKQTRMRSRFMMLLITKLNEIAQLHKDVLIKYAKKDDKDQPITKDVNGVENYDIADEKLETFKKEDQELLDESYLLDITEANKEMFETIKDLVLNTSYHFGPKEGDNDQEKQQKIQIANDYDTWCKAFEEAI